MRKNERDTIGTPAGHQRKVTGGATVAQEQQQEEQKQHNTDSKHQGRVSRTRHARHGHETRCPSFVDSFLPTSPVQENDLVRCPGLLSTMFESTHSCQRSGHHRAPCYCNSNFITSCFSLRSLLVESSKRFCLIPPVNMLLCSYNCERLLHL